MQQHHALKLGEVLCTHQIDLGVEHLVGLGPNRFQQIVVGDGAGGVDLLLQVQTELPLVGEHFFQRGQIPLFFNRFSRHKLAHDVLEAALAQALYLRRQIRGVENLVALLVNHLALVVGDVVVFEQLLAHVKVACFDLALGALDTARDHARLDGLAFGHLELVHDGAHAVTRKNAHQRIIQTQVKPRRTGVALTTRAAAQLVVDTA